MPISNYPNGFSGGVNIRGIPLLNAYGHNVYWVDSNSGLVGKGTFDRPCSTIAAAVALCENSKGDVIVAKAGHAEAPVATITIDKIGITIMGDGNGANRPTITPAFTVATDDVLDITAASVRIENIVLAAGANTGGNSIQLNVGAADCVFKNMEIQQGAINLTGVTIPLAGHRAQFINCKWRGTAANPDVAVQIEGKCDELVFDHCDFVFTESAGLDAAGIASAKTNTGIRISDCRFLGMDATALDFDSSATGIVERVSVYSTNATVNEMIDPGDLCFFDCKVGYISLSGATIPATTATP